MTDFLFQRHPTIEAREPAHLPRRGDRNEPTNRHGSPQRPGWRRRLARLIRYCGILWIVIKKYIPVTQLARKGLWNRSVEAAGEPKHASLPSLLVV